MMQCWTSLVHCHSPVTSPVGLYYYHNQQTPPPVQPAGIAMIAARKRKDAHNPRWTSRDKEKIRVIEDSTQELLNHTAKQGQPRTTPAGRTFTNIRKGSIKIFSLFRGGKSEFCFSTLVSRVTYISVRSRRKLCTGSDR
jgi:hypothetical protein